MRKEETYYRVMYRPLNEPNPLTQERIKKLISIIKPLSGLSTSILRKYITGKKDFLIAETSSRNAAYSYYDVLRRKSYYEPYIISNDDTVSTGVPLVIKKWGKEEAPIKKALINLPYCGWISCDECYEFKNEQLYYYGEPCNELSVPNLKTWLITKEKLEKAGCVVEEIYRK